MKKSAIENQETKLVQPSQIPQSFSFIMTKPIIDNLMEKIKDRIIFNQIEHQKKGLAIKEDMEVYR